MDVPDARAFVEQGRPSAAWYRFVDAHVAREHTHVRRTLSYDRWQRRQSRSYHIAPIVWEGWEPGEPVVAWAYCESGAAGSLRRCLARWYSPSGGATPARVALSGDEEVTRDEAVEALSLSSRGDPAPVLAWVEDPHSELRRDSALGAGLLLLGYAGASLGLMSHRRRHPLA